MSTPVVVFFFRRNHVYQVIEQVKKYRPSKLYLVADGGRNPDEHLECLATRNHVDKMIDWDCDVVRFYKETNLGVDVIIPQTITEIFKIEERLIILEDDVVADPSFFEYIEILLTIYKDEEKIMNICGTNWFDNIKFTNKSYFYTYNLEGYGWGTWRRAWGKYEHHMDSFEDTTIRDKIQGLFHDKFLALKYFDLFESHYIKVQEKDWKNSHWDGKWLFSCIIHGGLSVIPNVNLVTNIGFDESATHTKNTNSIMANKQRKSITSPLNINGDFNANLHYDYLYANKILGFSKVIFYFSKLKNFIKKILVK